MRRRLRAGALAMTASRVSAHAQIASHGTDARLRLQTLCVTAERAADPIDDTRPVGGSANAGNRSGLDPTSLAHRAVRVRLAAIDASPGPVGSQKLTSLRPDALRVRPAELVQGTTESVHLPGDSHANLARLARRSPRRRSAERATSPTNGGVGVAPCILLAVRVCLAEPTADLKTGDLLAAFAIRTVAVVGARPKAKRSAPPELFAHVPIRAWIG